MKVLQDARPSFLCYSFVVLEGDMQSTVSLAIYWLKTSFCKNSRWDCKPLKFRKKCVSFGSFATPVVLQKFQEQKLW